MLNKQTSGSYATALFTLLTSSSTLICCALPALLVSLGAGAALAGLVSTFPQLAWISRHKELIFGLAGLMLLISGYLQYRPQACPADPRLAQACAKAKRVSKGVFAVSVFIYLTGVFFAFIAPLFVN